MGCDRAYKIQGGGEENMPTARGLFVETRERNRLTLAKQVLGENAAYDIKTGKGSQEITLSTSQFDRVEKYLGSLETQKNGNEVVMVYSFGEGNVHFVRALGRLQINDLNPDICEGLLKAIQGEK